MNHITNYEQMKKEYLHGWNTYNNRSVLCHVHMPDCFAISLGIKDYSDGQHLCEALIGRFGEQDETVIPSYHAYDASYTELTVEWRGSSYHITSATAQDDLLLLVEPTLHAVKTPVLSIEAAILWNRAGYVARADGILTGFISERSIPVYHTGTLVEEPLVTCNAPHDTVLLDGAIGICTGKKRSLQEIRDLIAIQSQRCRQSFARFGKDSQVCKAMQCCLAWDTIYDPLKDRCISPVSRLWSNGAGGTVLFCWDTYFAALMDSVGCKELAYANAIEITREKTENGFVPNFAYSTGCKSRDRSQPPVGSWVIHKIYQKYQEKWFLEEVFDDLFRWNRWWFANRQISEGLFAWGSNAYTPMYGNYWESHQLHDRSGASLESGLDNSPMYDGVDFDPATNLMQLADVGLTSLVLLDCYALQEMAVILGKTSTLETLTRSIASIEEHLLTLWDDEKGFFYNRYPDGTFNYRCSPTNFYALYHKNLPQEKISRIIREHFNNEQEFAGTYILPSIARNDPAYPDNTYWRGRIWAPMNELVYIGLKQHPENEDARLAAATLAEKSKELILKEWLEHGHVHENYNGDTGEGCDVGNSDKFYHWGGLLSYLYLDEHHLL